MALYLDLNEVAARWKMIQGEANEVLRLSGIEHDLGEYDERIWHIEDLEAVEKMKNEAIDRIFARRPRRNGKILDGMWKLTRPKTHVAILVKNMFNDGIRPGAIAVRIDYPLEFVTTSLKSEGYNPSEWADELPATSDGVTVPGVNLFGVGFAGKNWGGSRGGD